MCHFKGVGACPSAPLTFTFRPSQNLVTGFLCDSGYILTFGRLSFVINLFRKHHLFLFSCNFFVNNSSICWLEIPALNCLAYHSLNCSSVPPPVLNFPRMIAFDGSFCCLGCFVCVYWYSLVSASFVSSMRYKPFKAYFLA